MATDLAGLIAALTPDELDQLQVVLDARCLTLELLGRSAPVVGDAALMVNLRRDWVRCQRPSCACRQTDERHGPYWSAYYPAPTTPRKRHLGKTPPAVLTAAQLAAGTATVSEAAYTFYADLATAFTLALTQHDRLTAEAIAEAMPDSARWLDQLPVLPPPAPVPSRLVPPAPMLPPLALRYDETIVAPGVTRTIMTLDDDDGWFDERPTRRRAPSWTPKPDLPDIDLATVAPPSFPMLYPDADTRRARIDLRASIDDGLAELATLQSISKKRGRPLTAPLATAFGHAVVATVQRAMLIEHAQTGGSMPIPPERLVMWGGWVQELEWFDAGQHRFPLSARSLEWRPSLRGARREAFLESALAVVRAWDAAEWLLAAAWRALPVAAQAAAPGALAQVRDHVLAWLPYEAQHPGWPDEEAPAWFWDEPAHRLQPVMTERGTKTHVVLDAQSVTLCAKYRGDELAVWFDEAECQHCARQARKARLVCAGCSQVLLAAWDASWCYRCVDKHG
ncbi:MAG TPA: hypothetical protein VGE07_07980 [Herpetosiphonaceae bacterium]